MSKLSKIFVIFFLFFVFLFFNKSVFADSKNFSTTYNVVYNVNNDGVTRVTLNIGLKNKTSDYYASSYEVQTGFDNISNIYVEDGSGKIDFQTQKNDKGTSVSFDFNEKTVGIDNTQKFSISFDTNEISKNYGSVWEVNIPGLSNQSDYEDFSVEVKTPKSIGPLSIIKPALFDLETNNNSIFFSKKDLGNGGVSIAYGTTQVYDFNLTYHLENKNLYPTRTEIAIPSDTNYQDVSINNISPRPEDVVIDKDGNWLAQYKLLPSQKLDVKVTGKARIYHIPRKEELSKLKRNDYLKADKYWEANDPQIVKLAKGLKTPENIYKYVTENLKYDAKRVEETQIRLGAIGTLKNKTSAVCLEFTDLFITLTRAAGIPARAVEGYANTTNSADRPLSLFEDVLHAWPEYYDDKKQAWIMVDPTWENTTKGVDYFNVLDFDHFAFVIKGEESDYPVPAGGYKIKKETKDVKVSTSSIYNEENPKVDISTLVAKNYTGGLPIEGEITVINNSSVATYPQNVKISVKGLKPASQNFYIDKIPPFGKKIIPISFKPAPLLTNSSYLIKINIGNNTIEKKILILPFYRNINFLLAFGGLIIGTFLLIISIFIARSRGIHLPGRGGRNPLRGKSQKP
jgi:transglutaminase-like putative cysteine protease